MKYAIVMRLPYTREVYIIPEMTKEYLSEIVEHVTFGFGEIESFEYSEREKFGKIFSKDKNSILEFEVFSLIEF